jgi:hypothetical protein
MDPLHASAPCDRRGFLKIAAAGTTLALGVPRLPGQDKPGAAPPRVRTNIDDFLKFPRTPASLPGAFPARVVQVHNDAATAGGSPDPAVTAAMFERGIEALTGATADRSFGMFFNTDDVVGIKVNPVGAGLISTRPELVEAVVRWLVRNGLPASRIVIWDRFETMLAEAGFTRERFPGVRIEGLQTMDEAAAEGKTGDNSRWRAADGTHRSAGNFDLEAFYWADVEGDPDPAYLNQHVFNGRHSYFGKLVTKGLTKIINVPVFKNCGNGVSMAAKNLGYGAICNTARLHKPLFFDVCTEVLAHPALRDKLVLNVTDGLRGQYDGGPSAAAKFIFPFNTLFFATDPFACDSVCHGLMVEKRKASGIRVNEHPMFTDYLKLAERLGLGTADPDRIELTRVET